MMWCVGLFVTPAMAATLEVGPDDDLSVLAALEAGDEVVLLDGVYAVSEPLVVSGVGTEQQPIVVRARREGMAVVEAAPRADGTYPGRLIHVVNADHVSVRGLVVRGDSAWVEEGSSYTGVVVESSSNVSLSRLEVGPVGGTGISLWGDTSGVTIQRTHVHDTWNGAGIVTGCYDASCWTRELVIFNNWIHDIGGSDGIGIRLHPGTQGARLDDNVIYATGSVGVLLGAVENGAPNTFERNALWSNLYAGVLIEGASLVRNNIIFNVEGRGIWSRNPGRATDTFGNLIVSHNTVVDTTDWAADLDGWDGAALPLVFSNNGLCNPIGRGVEIEVSGGDTAVSRAAGYVSSNVACGQVRGLDRFLGEVIPGGGFEDFTDAEGWNFYPVGGAISEDAADPAGDAWVPETDFNGVARPGDLPDVGAYERAGVDDNPGWPVREGFKDFELVYQNPQAFVGGCCDDSANDGAKAAVLLPLIGLGLLRRRREGAAD